jgi:ADP-heptose:LPS heptosyltransferase
MGDVAMLVPVLHAFVVTNPNIKITLLTRAFFKPMFSQWPTVSVVEADVKGKHKGLLGLYRLYRELKLQKIDAVLDMHNVLRSNILKIYFKMGRLPFFQIDKGRAEKSALTASRNKQFKPLKTTHERYADVFRKLGFRLNLKPPVYVAKLPLSVAARHFIKEGSKKKLIGIAPFAAYRGKMYPLFLMEQVIRLLKDTKKYKLLLFGGGPEEQRVLQKWADQFNGCKNIAGKVSFEEELTLIANLDLMLAMDSSNGHLAAMYGVPVLTLWGVTHPYAGFSPFGQQQGNALFADRNQFPLIPTSVYGNRVPKGYESAMETIKPQEVFRKIEDILNNE